MSNIVRQASAYPLRASSALALALSIVALVWVPHPVGWICGLWLAVCVHGAILPGPRTRRLLCLNASPLLLLLGAAEFYMGFAPVLRFSPRLADGGRMAQYMIPQDLLGYGPVKDRATSLQRYLKDELIFDVTYTIDEHGLRIAPPYEAGPDEGCILFFGGSYTYGDGLKNDETLPYRVGIETGGRHQIYNFGFHGYGPHQMLAALELGIVDSIVTCTPRYVIYQGSAFHIPRAAGLSSWEHGGPRFESTGDGYVEYRGRWDESRFTYPGWLNRIGRRSYVLSKLLTVPRPTGENDYDRYIGILETTRRHVVTQYPGVEVRIVYWDEPDDRVVADLEDRGFRVHRVSEILPDRAERPEKYRIHRLDKHPNALAASLIAKHLAASLPGGESEAH